MTVGVDLEGVTKLLETFAPKLAEVARAGESKERPGVGLFAAQSFKEGDVVYRWPCTPGASKLATVLEPSPALAQQFEGGEYSALAFQVLKASRSQEPTPWRDWMRTGVAAPETHPVKLLLSDPAVAQRLWSSTTCGSRMSATALQLQPDCELLEGGVDLEEWADMVALVISKCIVQDERERPLLVLGLDFVQDGFEANVVAQVEYDRPGGGAFGTGGGETKRRMVGVSLKAVRDIQAGEELTTRYLRSNQGGGYIERFGFLPQWLQGEFPQGSCVELTFAPVDEENDWFFQVKESHLEDLEITTDPLSFYFTSEDSVTRIRDSEDWYGKSYLDRMVQTLRFRHVSGPDSFLLEGVYITQLWDFCALRISKANETEVCKSVIEECDLWLSRFKAADEEEAASGPLPADGPLAWASDVRRSEAALLRKIRGVFDQEKRDTKMDESRLYWLDRKMDEIFPARKYTRATSSKLTGVDWIDGV